MKCIVIGAGLAGAACADALSRRGCQVSVLSEGGGASTVPVGLLAAHLSSQDIELSVLSRIGVALTLSQARRLLREGVDWRSGHLDQKLLFHREKNARLLKGAALLPDWYAASGAQVRHKQAAWIKPTALARAWLASPSIHVQQASVASIKRSGPLWQALDAKGQIIEVAQSIIIAAGAQAASLLAGCGYPLVTDNVRGSVAIGAMPHEWPSDSPLLINGHGHVIAGVADAASGAFWLSGATYERDTALSEASQRAASLQANQARLAKLLPPELLPSISAQFESGQVQSWQGSRCTTSDRLPIVGELEAGLYVCTAMGSRGLSFSALCAEILAREIMPAHESLSERPVVANALRGLLLPQRKTLILGPKLSNKTLSIE
jgi:tRNA 5-methylaminomethyl-2-thiouridine biosynthesis bifunctional protein